MTVSRLPAFKYHPDPLATGSVVESDTKCECCGERRGFVYTGPVYSVEEYEDCICPWCIADGSAREKLEATFTDEASVGAGEAWSRVPESVVKEVCERTPGFSGWQQEQWWTHCGDAAVYLGRAGREELEAFGSEAVEAIRLSTGLDDGAKWRESFAALTKDGSPRAYVFKCSVCGAFGGYQDSD